MRARTLFAAIALLLTACTGTTTPTAQPAPSVSTSATGGTTTPTTSPSGEPTSSTIVLGQPLPSTCAPAPTRATQTVAFVADGDAWALNPGSGQLSCMFATDDPGPFAWGPQGDRVLLGDMQLRFLDGSGAAIGTKPASVFDWGRPIGKAVVFREPDDTRKFILEDDQVEDLPKLPQGTYRSIAYHPSGLALALSVTDDEGVPQIFVSTNEGDRPRRIVFGVSATDFPSVDFTSDGRYLLYLAEHKGDYAQLHMIDLQHPDALINLWKSDAGVTANGLVLPPGTGDTLAFTTGDTCDNSVAVTGSVNEVQPAVPDAVGPTRALGYLDDRRLLVGGGGCDGKPMDLYVVSAAGVDLVATGVDVAAARANGPDGGVPLPEQLLGDVQEFG